MEPLVVADDVVLKEQEGEAFLLHLASGRYFGLNRSGLVVWEALRRGDDPIQALGERWPDLSEGQRRSDVERLAGALLESGLVRRATDPVS